jgi:hypothetical protein
LTFLILVLEENKMADLVNPTVLTGSGYNGGGMDGMGGMMGGLLFGALLGGNGGGLFGNRGAVAGVAGDVVTTAHLQSALNAQVANMNQNSTLQMLGGIAASIPENEGKVQLAIANQSGALSNQMNQLAIMGNQQANQNNIMQVQGIASVNANVAGATATIIAAEGAVKDAVAASATTQLLATAGLSTLAQQLAAGLSLQGANQTAAIMCGVRDDGDKTRALIVAQNEAYLNRIIIEQANALIELKNERHVTGNGITLQQTVNQAQVQSQAQQQQQQQFAILSSIASSLNGLTQIAHATNQNVIAGNTGAVTTGAQNANPVNVA